LVLVLRFDKNIILKQNEQIELSQILKACRSGCCQCIMWQIF
jgi:hypothetical protein